MNSSERLQLAGLFMEKRSAQMTKQAGPWSETFLTPLSAVGSAALGAGIGARAGGLPGALVGGSVGLTPTLIGTILAGLTRTRTREEQIEREGDNLKNLIPGVGNYNWFKRLGHMASEGDNYSGVVSEAVAPALTDLLAKGVGYAVDGHEGAHGLGAANSLANLIGMLSAAGTPTRNREEQHETENYTAQNLVPGVGSYNAMKRLGYAIRGEGSTYQEYKKRKKEEEEDKDKEKD